MKKAAYSCQSEAALPNRTQFYANYSPYNKNQQFEFCKFCKWIFGLNHFIDSDLERMKYLHKYYAGDNVVIVVFVEHISDLPIKSISCCVCHSPSRTAHS